MKLTIDCEREHIKIIQSALEEYFRFRMKQADIVSDFLAEEVCPLKKDFDSEEKWEIAFSNWIEMRRCLKEAVKSAINITYGGCYSFDSIEGRNATDIWAVIRYTMYKKENERDRDMFDVRSAEPVSIGTLPMVKITVED